MIRTEKVKFIAIAAIAASQTGSSRCEVHRCGARRALVFMAVALVILVAMISAASAQQTWYLSASSGGAGTYIMYRGSPGGTSNDPSIASGGTAIWRANESAICVTFPAGNWTFKARRTDNTGARDIDVSIGVWSGSAFTAHGTVRGDLLSNYQWTTFIIPASGFSVPQGQYLALRVQNNHGDNEFQIDASDPARSNVTSPSDSPAYPGQAIPPGAALNVTKVAEGEEPYSPGDTITYNITVCNPGNVTLTNVRVNDPLLGFNHVFGTLAPNECNWTEFTYTVTDGDAVNGWINNTVYVYNGSTLYNQSYENVTVECNSQDWYLSSTTTTGGRIMYQGGYASWSDISITIGNCVIWIANESTATGVAFPAGTWGLRTRRTSITGSVDYNVSIGIWDNDTSTFTAKGTISGTTFPESWTTLDIDTTAFTVPSGDFLALRICNLDAGYNAQTLTVDCSGSPASYLTSPCSDPGYPGVIPPGAALNVTKTVITAPPYYPGKTITYNITVCNIGNVTLENVAVNDPLLGFNHLFGTLAPGNCTSVELNYSVRDADACRGWINNTAYVCSGGIAYNESSASVTVSCTGIPANHVDLFLLVDGSTSMGQANFDFQKIALADVVSNASVVPRDGHVSVCLILFGNDAELVVPLTPVTNETIDQINASILGMTWPGSIETTYTEMWEAFDLASASICCNESGRQVIDLSTDGEPWEQGASESTPEAYNLTWIARNNSLKAGFEVINTLGLEPVPGQGYYLNQTFLQNLSYPSPPWNDTEGFYLYADAIGNFTWAINTKIQRELGQSMIGDFVWLDCNVSGFYDGIQQPDEPGVHAVNVSLYTGTGSLVNTTTTNESGYYSFTNLNSGEYYLVFELPDGYKWTLQDQGANDSIDSDVNASTSRTINITLAYGEKNMTWDAGLASVPCLPVPEEDTVVLFSAGLLTLAGYLVVRRRK